MLKSYSGEQGQDEEEIRNPAREWYKTMEGIHSIPFVKNNIDCGNPTPYTERIKESFCSRFVLETVGTSLIEVNDNRQLVRAVMDMIIGTSSILVMCCGLTPHVANLVAFGKGLLHSDASIGNVLVTTSHHKDDLEIPVTKAMCDGMK